MVSETCCDLGTQRPTTILGGHGMSTASIARYWPEYERRANARLNGSQPRVASGPDTRRYPNAAHQRGRHFPPSGCRSAMGGGIPREGLVPNVLPAQQPFRVPDCELERASTTCPLRYRTTGPAKIRHASDNARNSRANKRYLP